MPPPTTGGGSIIFPVCPLTTPISRDAMSHYLWRNANVTFHAMRLNSRTGLSKLWQAITLRFKGAWACNRCRLYGPPPCARDHQAVVRSCSHLARMWAALERRSAWLVVVCTSKGVFQRNPQSSRASKTYGHNAFQIIHIHATVINSARAHTTQHRTHCGLWLRLQSWLMPQPPHRLWNDLKCVECDVKPCSTQPNLSKNIHHVSGNCWRCFQGQKSKVTVMTRPFNQ